MLWFGQEYYISQQRDIINGIKQSYNNLFQHGARTYSPDDKNIHGVFFVCSFISTAYTEIFMQTCLYAKFVVAARNLIVLGIELRERVVTQFNNLIAKLRAAGQRLHVLNYN